MFKGKNKKTDEPSELHEAVKNVYIHSEYSTDTTANINAGEKSNRHTYTRIHIPCTANTLLEIRKPDIDVY